MQLAPARPTLRSRVIPSPLGPMTAISDGDALVLLEFGKPGRVEAQSATLARHDKRPVEAGDDSILDLVTAELGAYFARSLTRFTVPIHAWGTPFQSAVWQALLEIPFGETRTYSQIAAAIGRPSAVRATAKANGDNRLGIIIPCHRVIGADGTLTGYGGGLDRKEWLLSHEGAPVGDRQTLWTP